MERTAYLVMTTVKNLVHGENKFYFGVYSEHCPTFMTDGKTEDYVDQRVLVSEKASSFEEAEKKVLRIFSEMFGKMSNGEQAVTVGFTC